MKHEAFLLASMLWLNQSGVGLANSEPNVSVGNNSHRLGAAVRSVPWQGPGVSDVLAHNGVGP